MNSTLRKVVAKMAQGQGWTPGTGLENQVAYRLGKHGFGPEVIRQQHRIGPYRVDFAHVDKKIAIEADGWYHRSPEGAAKDAQRDSWLRANGWLVLRVDDRHGLDALDEQVGRIVRWMIADTWAGR